MKVHKKDDRQDENRALKNLTIISEGQTGYIDDWVKMNEIRSNVESSKKEKVLVENDGKDMKKKQGNDYVNRKTMNNFGHRKVYSLGINKKSEQNYKVLCPHKISFLREKNRRLNEQFSVQKCEEKVSERKKHNNFVTQSCQTQRLLNMSRYQPFLKFRNEHNQMNTESNRKVSCRKLGNEDVKNCYLTEGDNNYEKILNGYKISQLIKNKIKKRRDQKCLTQRSQIKRFITEENSEIVENVSFMVKVENMKFVQIKLNRKLKENRENRLNYQKVGLI